MLGFEEKEKKIEFLESESYSHIVALHIIARTIRKN